MPTGAIWWTPGAGTAPTITAPGVHRSRDDCADNSPGPASRAIRNACVVEDFLGNLLDDPADTKADEHTD